MLRFEVCQALAGPGVASGLGMAADVVMHLCDDIQQKNHKVFFDNFFCAIPLIQAQIYKHNVREHTTTCFIVFSVFFFNICFLKHIFHSLFKCALSTLVDTSPTP
ncbi:hypothetical protein NQD34_018204 [Periophthalmus magnuspinnatus]|nr:hypothetical protein NQD34_018204 [Periophthalmus magnuspinnatus]